MKSWRRILLLLLAVFVCLFSIRYAVKTRAQKRRALMYQAALDSYSQALQPGMTRKEVEDYLGTKNAPLHHMCCVKVKGSSNGAYDDLTKIGQEDPPWFCSQNNVYIAFLFIGPKRAVTTADPSDRLTSIELFPHLEGCL
jgi:hypothetical protein